MPQPYIPTEQELQEQRDWWVTESGFTWDELVELAWLIWPEAMRERLALTLTAA